MKKQFSIIHDLSQVSEEGRKQYLVDLSEFFGLPPELNALDTIWMNNDDGLRHLVAYARRGTTDILRDKHGIDVLSLEKEDGLSYVSYKATGKNKTGRQEIAVGAHSIEGLRGDRLAAAIATAQTRALRRLTLQFVGGGLLDESEINTATTSIQSQSTSLNELSKAPQPVVKLNDAPGRDITSKLEKVLNAPPGAHTALGTPGDPSGFVAAVTQATGQTDVPGNPRTAIIEQLNKQAAPEPAPKKTRKRRAKVDMGTSTNPIPALVVSEPMEVQQSLFVPSPAPEPKAVAAVELPPTAAPSTVPVKSRLTSEQAKPYRTRLFHLVNDQLEIEGEFAPRDGMGNHAKMKAFAVLMFPEVVDFNDLTTVQWEKYLGTLEDKVKTEGAVAAVKYIEDAIGI